MDLIDKSDLVLFVLNNNEMLNDEDMAILKKLENLFLQKHQIKQKQKNSKKNILQKSYTIDYQGNKMAFLIQIK